MNTPTQEQIDAALRYADDMETAEDNEVIDAALTKTCFHTLANRFSVTSAILAAAYREQQRDIAETKQQRDTLANALRYLIESCESIDCDALMPSSMPDSYDKAIQALDTLKGEA